MSLSATLFGRNSAIFKATNILGLGIPGWLDKKFGVQDAQGPPLGEMASQTSKEGVARPIIWGIVRPIGGNVIACSDPVIRQIESDADSGGKGGGSKDKKTYVDAVFRSYAIRICEGPITGIRRVWRNSVLIYDGRGTTWGATNNPVFLAKATFYLGGWDQQPSPVLQSVFGVAAVTAHRGTCYMVVNDEDLTDLGGAVPQFMFEVERAEGFPVTSRPYPIEDIAGVASLGVTGVVAPPLAGRTEGAESGGTSVVGGELRSLLRQVPITEGLDATYDLTGGDLRTLLKSTSPSDSADSNGTSVTGGELRRTLISYSNYAPEGVNSDGSSLSGGSLS